VNLVESLGEYGLFPRGATRLTDQEIETYGFPADKPELVLVGNIGSSYWPLFSQSAEYLDGAADPLDRWSRRVANEIAVELAVLPVYPFTGPPYYPFQQWAQRAEALVQSPLGVMMHPEFGLWHSYRFALLGAEFDLACEAAPTESPCFGCESQPCLHRCPVSAIDGDGYDVERCASYLLQTPQAECHSQGCLARYACPIATDLSYLPEQGEFHLRAFLNARK
jgi:hypothetical protein